MKGSVKSLLKTERKILDIIGRMSGIATMTFNLRKLVKGKVMIAATRKSLLGYPDKKAVFIGGGLTHRLALWDGVLLKDNHFELFGDRTIMEDTVEEVVKKNPKFPVVAEAKDENEALWLADVFGRLKNEYGCVFVIMFDNLQPTAIRGTINKIKRINLYDGILFEASGNITEKNIKDYADTGVDYVSVGALTHSVKAFDVSLRLK